MAKCKKISVPPPQPPPEPVYVLEMTETEASVLRYLMACVGGMGPFRAATERIGEALEDCGLEWGDENCERARRRKGDVFVSLKD